MSIKRNLTNLWPLFGLLLWLAVPILGHAEDEYPALTLTEIAQEAPVWRGHALEVMRRFPPDQFLYVGMGRSPTPLIAALKVAAGEKAAINLPMSHVRKFGYEDQVGFDDLGEIRDAHWENLTAHLRRFLPSKSELRGRRILLMDFCDTGTSLIAALPLLREFYVKHLGSQQDGVVGLGITASDSAELTLTANRISVLPIDETIHQQLERRQYREFTEYDQFFVNIAGIYRAPGRHKARFEMLKNSFRNSTSECETLLKAQ